ncbi:MAG TPA: carboxylesterase family protein [Puia sp.]|nr:carboxylesterase family protein [Puia sp.]
MKSLKFPLFLLCFVFAKGYCQQSAPVVRTEAGLVSGIKDDPGKILTYKGIPFAAPPVGELRWKAPQPVKPWNGVRACTAFGPSPMQGKPVPFSMWTAEFLIAEKPISEDCLYLNIWTPATGTAEKRPVLVWIYGGGFVSGGASAPIYDGEAMAKKGILFVSINYRVGIFGFFAHPELSKTSGYGASGNYGLLDQIAALKWIKKNIAAFGGDPERVTIAGQSAGSMSVNCLVVSPLARGLFIRAIGESGASFTHHQTGLAEAEQRGVKIAQTAGDGSLGSLMKMPAEELYEKTRNGYGPVVDGYVLPASIAEIFADGRENKADLLTGWNQDEGFFSGQPKHAADYRKDATEKYGSDSILFLSLFPGQTDSIAAQSQMDMSRDLTFGLQNYSWANRQSEQPGSSVYVYRFIRKPPARGEYVKYGAFHTGEVPYAYNNLRFVDRPWQAVDFRLADIMSSYWVNFVATGNPNGPGLPRWPAYTQSGKQIMLLNEEPHAGPMPDDKALDFLLSKQTAQ